MLNLLWPVLLISSFIFAIISGNIPETNSAIFASLQDALNLTLTLLGTMCLWCGIIKIAINTNIMNYFFVFLKPILRKIFPEINENDEVYKEISLNIIANVLGLGNAATPLGIKAIQSLQKNNKNKEKLSNSMTLLIVLNTASIQIIPTTVIAIRNSLGSNNPTIMLVPIWIATICAAIAAILSAKFLIKKGF